MAFSIKLFVVLTSIFQCNCVSWRRQLEHIAKMKQENPGIKDLPSRRFYQLDPRELSSVLGVPSRPSHLPEAEPILPGHTLLRPALGMLKSAIKFPHKELEDGAGVYGNVDNLGIKYDGRNERVMYSGFRRFPADYLMVIPSTPQNKYEKPRFKIESAVLNLEREAQARNELRKVLKKLNIPSLKGVKVFIATENGFNWNNLDSLSKDTSYYMNKNMPANFISKTGVYGTEERNEEALRNSMNSFEEDATEIPKSAETVVKDKMKKMEWFLKSKDQFNHIKLTQDAPELNELVPESEDEKLRKWWFYSADDYQPFSRELH